jgi:hypothetical protein
MSYAEGQMAAAGNLGLVWNPKHLEIKTRSVEKTLEPLVMQVIFFEFLHTTINVQFYLGIYANSRDTLD